MHVHTVYHTYTCTIGSMTGDLLHTYMYCGCHQSKSHSQCGNLTVGGSDECFVFLVPPPQVELNVTLPGGDGKEKTNSW